MIQSPFTKEGTIRYIELIKIFILVSFLFAAFSGLSSKTQTATSMFGLLTILFVIQVLASDYKALLEIIHEIKTFIVKRIDYTSTVVIDVSRSVYQSFKASFASTISYLQLCVIRC